MPFFSIGVTSYRRPALLAECLRSILGQECQDFEVFVGNDDPKTPISLEDLGVADPRIQLINREKNLGEMANMNDLLGRANGRYFTWIADDDMYCPQFFSTIRRVLEEQGFPACVVTDYATGPSYEAPVNATNPPVTVFSGRDYLGRLLRRELTVLGGSAVWNTQHLRSLGGIVQLGTGFSPGSDTILSLKAGLQEKIPYVDSKLIFFRTHRESASFASVDLEAYRTAHEDFFRQSEAILGSPPVRADFDRNLYEVLSHWCAQHFYSVLGRNENVPLGALFIYLAFVFRSSRALGAGRWRLCVKIAWDLHLILRARLARHYHSWRGIERYS